MKVKTLAIIAAATLAMSSCSTQRSPLPYFVDIEQIKEPISAEYTGIVLQPDDELIINVSSLNPEASAHYNLPLGNVAPSNDILSQSNPKFQTYIIDPEGDIKMPVLGKIHVAGLTVEQLQEKLEKLISNDVQDPIVRVQIINYRVNVAGEVRRPGSLSVYKNRYSILDALTDAGDLTEYGERSNVLLIREENGQRTYHRLDLNSADLLKSPYFYLKQNDYIYVEPNAIRVDNSKYNQNNAFKLSLAATIVSGATSIISLIIALTR